MQFLSLSSTETRSMGEVNICTFCVVYQLRLTIMIAFIIAFIIATIKYNKFTLM